jgi:hypothetical protein
VAGVWTNESPIGRSQAGEARYLVLPDDSGSVPGGRVRVGCAHDGAREAHDYVAYTVAGGRFVFTSAGDRWTGEVEIQGDRMFVYRLEQDASTGDMTRCWPIVLRRVADAAVAAGGDVDPAGRAGRPVGRRDRLADVRR